MEPDCNGSPEFGSGARVVVDLIRPSTPRATRPSPHVDVLVLCVCLLPGARDTHTHTHTLTPVSYTPIVTHTRTHTRTHAYAYARLLDLQPPHQLGPPSLAEIETEAGTVARTGSTTTAVGATRLWSGITFKNHAQSPESNDGCSSWAPAISCPPRLRTPTGADWVV
eukprot:m.325484 g.325484  ORF g.325484 m.325484 type:complete len:167 (+) comp27649_c3_seq1:5096-5596(+)